MQCILGTSNPVIMAVRALSLVLLFTFVSVIFGLPTTPVPEPAVNTQEEHTLSTELLPPPVDEKEHHATIYIINLYAVKNGSSNASEEMFQNEVVETIPDILEPLVSVLLVIDDDENEELEKHPPVDLDEFAEGLEGQGFKVDKIDLNSKAKVLKMKLEKAEAESMIDSVKGNEKKFRQKRTICLKCGGGGGYGGGYGGYPSGGGGQCSTCGGGYGAVADTAAAEVVILNPLRRPRLHLEPVLDNNKYRWFCKSDGTQRPGENVGLRVVKHPLTPIDRAIVGKDSSSTIARIFWSLTVVGRRTPWTLRPQVALHRAARKNWANQGQIVKTYSDE
ncbi:Uncharacterized protein DBV15_03452 [Temnothorax longispinosus]|uniref:Uncharacterized protein n=2 Tax=Temnothorax TaxID=300110 RepID=A0A4S2KIS8_9HYME|nr:Uncharacterized protein DBV15_03452 [Temnothorax longispinosus]